MNKFSYQSIEEVDPVDLAALLGSAGGMWGESNFMYNSITEDVNTVYGVCG